MIDDNFASDEPFSVADLCNRAEEAERKTVAPLIRRLAKAGWEPGIRRCEGYIPLVWLHRDGSWGFLSKHSDDPGDYYADADRIDTVGKLLEWIRHLSTKGWVTGEHINEMVLLFERLHPGTIHYGC